VTVTGIKDDVDKCPDDQRTMTASRMRTAAPDPDNTKDGIIPDELDACPQ